MDAALDAGICHFDVAPMYTLGLAEGELGRFALGRRDGVVIATKFGIEPTPAARLLGVAQAPVQRLLAAFPGLRERARQPGADPTSGRVGRLLYRRSFDAGAARKGLERSLQALRTDHVDILFVHDPLPQEVETDGVAEYLESARSTGLIGAWGVAGEPESTLAAAARLGPDIPVLQLRRGLLDAGRRDEATVERQATIRFGVIGRALPTDPRARPRGRGHAPSLERNTRRRLRRCRGDRGSAATRGDRRRPFGARSVQHDSCRPGRGSREGGRRSDRRVQARALSGSGRGRGGKTRGAVVIVDALSVDSELRADLAIVGAGPAGIVTALEVADAGFDVVLVESGRAAHDPRVQALGDAETLDGDLHAPMSMATRRGIGGASAIWGGRCVPYDPVDFDPRPWVTGHEWPVGYEALVPYFQRACDWFVCGEAVFDATRTKSLPPSIVPGLPNGDLRTSSLERWSLPTDFGRRYRDRLRDAARVRLVTGATCTQTVPRQDGADLDRLVCRTLEGKELTIRARRT